MKMRVNASLYKYGSNLTTSLAAEESVTSFVKLEIACNSLTKRKYYGQRQEVSR